MISKEKIKALLNTLLKSPLVINVTTVALIALIIKGFGFYKEVVVAGTFGLSELLDTFFIAALLPGFINQVFLIAFKSVFIPSYVAELKQDNNVGAIQTASLLITIVAGLVFVFISYLITDVFLDVFFTGHTEAYYQLIKVQFYYLAPCILLWGMGSLISGLLNIHDEFKYATIYPILTSISMLICIIFFKDVLQEKVLAVGMLIGSALELLLLFVVAYAKKIIVVAKPDFKSKNIQMMFNQLPARIASGFLSGLIPVTDQYFAAKLAIGSIAALNYGMKIPAFFASIIIMALGSVLLPYFSNITLDNKEEAYKKLFSILKILFIGITIVILPIIFFSNTIIAFLFERNAFTEADTDIVSNIQIVFLISIPFSICGDAIVRFLTSINKNAFLAYVSLITMLLNIIFDYIFMKAYGIMGIAICTTVVIAIKVLIFIKYTNMQRKIVIIKQKV